MEEYFVEVFRRVVNDQIYARLCERIARFEQNVEDRVRSIMKIRAEQPILVCKIFSSSNPLLANLSI